MNKQQFSTWIAGLVNQAWVRRHRRLVILKGEEQWASSLLASSPISHLLVDNENCFVYGDSATFNANIPYKRFRDFLGRESQCLIFSDSQFNFDAFAALSGTLKAGGLCFVLLPCDINVKAQRFIQRFLTHIINNEHHIIIEQGVDSNLVDIKVQQAPNAEKACHYLNENRVIKGETLLLGCANEAQLDAVNAVGKVLTGHRKRPLVLTADRGRGKSTALAIACAQLLNNHKAEREKLHIGVTAPDKQALSVFFQQLAARLPDMSTLNGEVTFIAIDDLVQNHHTLSLLLVDEAAGVPVYLLHSLLKKYHRTVFASTVHGYEGAGRGFTVKFTQILAQLTPKWHALHLAKPIRWAENDPLEQLVFDVGLLNANLPDLNKKVIQPLQSKATGFDKRALLSEGLIFEQINIEHLLKNEVLLSQIFAILISAHYQTKPSDLKMMLENPKVRLFTLSAVHDDETKLVGVALLLIEGGLLEGQVSTEDVSAVQQSKRRLKSQFIPQSLLTHCAMENAFDYRYLRVMRIAIHPEVQHAGFGSYFMKQLLNYAQDNQVDYIGASFGANYGLFSYWIKQGFSAIRLGFNKDKSSGEHSVLVLQPLTCMAKSAQQSLATEFSNSFRHLLLDEFKGLPSELSALILSQCKETDMPMLTQSDQRKIAAFVNGEMLYSHCAYSLYLWFVHFLLQLNSDVPEHTTILVSRLLQKNTVAHVCEQYGLSGKKTLNQLIIQYVSNHFKS